MNNSMNFKPCDTPRRAVYVGRRPELAGKTALVGTAFVGGVPLAQFDDVGTGYGYGWTPFKLGDFRHD